MKFYTYQMTETSERAREKCRISNSVSVETFIDN